MSGAAAGRRPRTPREELAEGTPHGDVYLGRLIRAQLRLSLLALGAFGGLVGSLPLLFLLFPGLQEVEPLPRSTEPPGRGRRGRAAPARAPSSAARPARRSTRRSGAR